MLPLGVTMPTVGVYAAVAPGSAAAADPLTSNDSDEIARDDTSGSSVVGLIRAGL